MKVGRACENPAWSGFTDPNLLKLRSDALTVSRCRRMTFRQAAADNQWSTEKGDVVGAFLQGRQSTDEPRWVYIKPVPELRRPMNLSEGHLAQLLKAGYGLTSAPRQWWPQVSPDMEALSASIV